MTKLRHFTGAIPFFVAVFLNAFVDLGHKIIIQNTIFKLEDGPQQVILTAIINGLILLPFILMISPAGFLSDRFRKTSVMQLSAWAAVLFTCMITAFYYMGWFWAAFGMTFLLAAQSALYSPAKYGYIKELFGKERLGEANGAVASISIVAILAGIFAYSVLFESMYDDTQLTEADILKAIAPIGFLLIINSVIELIMMYRLPPQEPTGNTQTFSVNKYVTGRLFKSDLKPLADSRTIRLSVVGIATFWGVGQILAASFPAFFKEVLNNDNTIVAQGIFACTGIGIAVGSIISGKFSKSHIETGLLPLGAIGIAVGLWALPSLSSSFGFACAFLLIGLSGGVFIVPLNALVQFNAKENELGKTLAASNWVQNMVMLSFLILTATAAQVGLSSKNLLQFTAVIATFGCFYVIYQLPQSLIRFVLGYVLSRRYSVSVQGMKNVPVSGGILLLGNHVSWIDWAIVQIACPRPVRFVMIRSIYERWYLKWFFDLLGCIPIEAGPRSRKALTAVADALMAGDVVCLFPEGTISRTGHLAEFRKGYERACKELPENIKILPFYLRGLWGSQFSRSSTRITSSGSSFLTREIIVAFGTALDNTTQADVLKRRVLDLSISSWQQHINDMPAIGEVWIDSAKKAGRKTLLVDNTMNVTLSGHKTLTASITFARRVKQNPQQNIAVLLPTSAGGAILNMAVLLAGKTVVNINYTSSKDAIKNALEQAEINVVYTSTRFLKKLEKKGIQLDNVFEGLELVDIEALGKSISSTEKLLTLIAVKCIPSCILSKWYCRGHDATSTAAILFSSGSEGSPKGVMLSHQNILANVKQVAEVLNIQDNDAIMANLPLFHAFGLTITQFLPLLEGCPMICHADPTDAFGGAKAIARYQATIMCGTSTFFRLYCRNHKVHPLMLQSLRIVVAGAEKLNDDVRTAFELKFNKPLLEGYGATETTPVASVNLPDKMEPQTFQVQKGNQKGSVGMPLPGTSCMVVDPDSFEELPSGEAGMILIGGVQVMQGYLNNEEKTASVIHEADGTRWYITGDKGYIDENGYLFIVDRYSRFAKLGGEMVSLGSVEAAIRKVVNNAEYEVIVVAIPDDKKGEKLIALYQADLDIDGIKQGLKDNELPPLSTPSKWVQLEAMPKLGSGKTDFSAAKKVAMEGQ